MLIESLLLASALAGTAAGGWIDLKTTEIPDTVPIAMFAAGIILHSAESIISGSPAGLISAFTAGILYLAIGYVLYYTGQWGEADVLLLAATGFLIPYPLSFFSTGAMKELYPLVFLINTFIVGGIYSLAYSAVLTTRNPDIFTNFFKDAKKNSKRIALTVTMLTAGLMLMAAVLGHALRLSITPAFVIAQLMLFIPAATALILMYRFALVLDNTAFKKKIASANLKAGDVLAEDVKLKDTAFSGRLFIGLTENQVGIIKKEKSHVTIKEGIRYGPTFFLSILFTWFFGNSVFLVFGWI